MSVPLDNCKVAYVWRKQWKVIFFFIPAASIHCLSGWEIQDGSGKSSKTNFSGFSGSPQSCKACSEMGVYSTPLVFCWVKCSLAWLPSMLISFHRSFWISQWRNPVSAEKRAARLSTSRSQGVATSLLSSSTDKYSLRDSWSWIPFILADKSTVR